MKEIKIKLYTLKELKEINHPEYKKEIDIIKEQIININLEDFINYEGKEFCSQIESILNCSIEWSPHYYHEVATVKLLEDKNTIGVECFENLINLYIKIKKLESVTIWSGLFKTYLREYIDLSYIKNNDLDFIYIIERILNRTYAYIYDDVCLDIPEEEVLDYYEEILEDEYMFTSKGEKIFL